MNTVELNTSLLGSMKFPNEKGLLEDYTLVLDGKEITTAIDIWENFINESNLSLVQEFLEKIPVMYKKAKETIARDYEKNPIMIDFIKFHFEELDLDDISEYFQVDKIQELVFERIISKLEPRAIRIAPVGNQGEIDCTFDFSIDPELSDELLVILFDQNFEIYDITHES
jgi:hypothetical protein